MAWSIDGVEPPPPPLPPPSMTCELCGAWPARRMVFRLQTAFVFVAQTETSNVLACRSCGLALGRKIQNRTLISGWWGIISFFRNLAYVGKNARELRNTAQLAASTGGRPAAPGRPVFARVGFWLSSIGLVAASVLVIAAATQHDPKWEVGACVSGTSRVSLVDCADPHVGKIVALVANQLMCPEGADGFVSNANGGVWCIDTSL